MLRIQSDQLTEQRTINAQQAKVLELQASDLRESLDERKQEAQLRRRAQAERVFIGQLNTVDANPDQDDEPERHRATVTVVNTSDRPIYDAGLRWPPGSTWEWPPIAEPLGTIMPGDRIQRLQYFPLGTDMTVNVATLEFRDAAGITWTRRPDGHLVEQEKPGPQPR
jgi:hypothetical protein